MQKRASLQIVAFYDEIDLRSIIAQSLFLKKVADDHRLQNGQAICYTNKKQDRFRLVMQVKKFVAVVTPEIDKTRNLSLYLHISETLASLAGVNSDVAVSLEHLQAATMQRMRVRNNRNRRRKENEKHDKGRKDGRTFAGGFAGASAHV